MWSSSLSSLLILLVQFEVIYCISSGIKAVSVFKSDEIIYHKYSAVLAATEPFRIQLEKDIENAFNPIYNIFRKIQGLYFSRHVCEVSSTFILIVGPFAKSMSEERLENAEVDDACMRYEKRVDDIVR